MLEKSSSVAAGLPDLDCACATIRRASRLVTQLYSRQMGGEVEPAQFSLLEMLSRRPGASQAVVGRALGLDKTTLSRSLLLMKRNGWIALARTGDLRERGYRLTPLGTKTLAAAKPGWKRAQAKLRAALQPGEWEGMMKVFSRAAEVALAARSGPAGRS